jgi:hypothetical protein
MKANEETEKFKEYLKTLCLEALNEVKNESEVFMPNYELRIKLIDTEIVVRIKQIEKLRKTLKKAQCELGLLKANIFYPVNEN